jgi:hypothetical protein
VATAALGLLAVLAATPASSDWLVLRDGSTVETAGPWRVEGRLVVFERPRGPLMSVRLDDLLLPASEEATAAARAALAAPRPAAESQPVRRKARVVLTDADIPRAQPERPPEAADAAGGREAAAAGASDLVVLSWEAVEAPFGGGMQIYGTVQNQGLGTLTGAGLRVLLYDSAGLLLTSGEAQLMGSVLPSHARSNFTVGFDGVFGPASGGVFALGGVRFDPYYRGFEPRTEPGID